MIARHYIPQGGKVYDLGCSTGNIGRVLAPTLHEREARLVALDEWSGHGGGVPGAGEGDYG